MIYLDNGATSFPKPSVVLESMSEFMKSTMANPGRSGHRMALETNKAILETRIKLAKLIGSPNPLQIAFTKNASEGINMGILGLLEKGDHVITTVMEHNSVLRPLHKLKSDGIVELSVVQGDHNGIIHWEEILPEIRMNTALIVVTHGSNLLGSINDIGEIGKEIDKINQQREQRITFMVDCAQTAGNLAIDVGEMKIHMLAGAGHKSLYGPTGTGFLYIDENVDLEPIYRGGTGSNSESLNQPEFMPDMLETGTVNAVGIVGLGAGIQYIFDTGLDQIRSSTQLLVAECIRQLEKIDGVKIYGPKSSAQRSGTVGFNIGERDSQEITGILSEEYNIATRGGIHCAPLAHNRMGTLEQGMVRASFSSFNQQKDVEALVKAVEQIALTGRG